jgi:RNA polymerase sigma-70 factor (ECF subfamily)
MTQEETWIQTFRGGDVDRRRALWGEVYVDLAGRVLALAEAVTGDAGLAEDVLQETFLTVWGHGDRFRGDGSLRGWILTIAANLARRTLVREQSRRRRRPPRPPGPTSSAVEALVAREREERIRRALAELPPQQRLAVSLSVLEGVRTEEIAAVLGCPVGTVWSRVHHAKRKLAGRIGRLTREEDR